MVRADSALLQTSTAVLTRCNVFAGSCLAQSSLLTQSSVVAFPPVVVVAR